jgi:sterol desaturase/sphingolipid hydroxylase (fatty acid hydroxylase superfamily)
MIRSMVPYALQHREIQLLVGWSVLFAGAVAWVGQPMRALPHLIAGAASWLVLEYVLHRFVLHALGPVSKAMERLGLNIHWRHHLEPNVEALIFTPWWASALLILGTFGVGSLSEGLVSATGAALGISLVSVHYETTHLSFHVPYVPKTRLGRYMRRLHLLHHFQNEQYWYGVTQPLGDLVFGTLAKPEAVERSPTVRTLGFSAPG